MLRPSGPGSGWWRTRVAFGERTAGAVLDFPAPTQLRLLIPGAIASRVAKSLRCPHDVCCLEFCRYLRTLYPRKVRIAIVCDNFCPHLTTKKCQRVGTWAAENSVEIAYTPTNSSWLNRIEAQFTALRYFTLDGTDHATHKEQGSMIRRDILWRNRHADDRRLRAVVDRANVA